MSAMARATLASFVLLFSDFPSGASASFYGPGGPQRRGASRTPPALPLLADRHSQLQQQEEEARRAAPRHLQRRRERERGRERGPLRNRRRQARRKGRKRRRQVEEEESREYSACETLEGEEGQCKPLVLCAGRNVEDARENKCLIRSAEEDKALYGICCSRRTVPPTKAYLRTNVGRRGRVSGGRKGEGGGVVGRVLVNQVGPKGQRKMVEEAVEQEGEDDIDIVDKEGHKVEVRQIIESLGETESQVEAMMRKVDNQLWSDDAFLRRSLRSSRRDPEALHNIFNAPDIGSKDINHKAEKLIRQTEIIQETNNLTAQTAGVGLRKVNAQSTSLLKTECPWIPAPLCNPMAKYRTINGSCNNLNQPNYGMARTPYQRMVLPKYAQGTIHLPRESVTGDSLPSARLLSKRITWPTAPLSTAYNTIMMEFGQFVAHDVAFTPNHNGASCCRGRKFPKRVNNDVCIPIRVPDDDPFWGPKKRRCLGLTRSIASPGLLCELEFRQQVKSHVIITCRALMPRLVDYVQMNQVTHWLDLSLIYGSGEYLANALREKRGGLMLTDNIRDTRTNEQYLLTSYHTIFLREHNHIAEQLARMNPSWDDEKLYQEARRINIAEYQHITYNEYLPNVLGKEMISAFSLGVHSRGQHSSWYSPDTDARIPNEFAAAAFRFGHSTIPSHFVRGRNLSIPLTTSDVISLRTTFFNPGFVQEQSDLLDQLMRGGLNQPSFVPDGFFVLDVLDHLFEEDGHSGGLDLLATNIMRGRDHGLPGYNTYREACNVGTGRAKSFDDFVDVMRPSDVEKLKQYYAHYDDVDLYIGGLMELPLNDSLLGPTFICVIGDTFARLRCGDRFFYDLGVDPVVQLSRRQLQEVRKVSLARILCNVFGDLKNVQPRAMHIPDPVVNRPVPCSDTKIIPKMDFSVFNT